MIGCRSSFAARWTQIQKVTQVSWRQFTSVGCRPCAAPKSCWRNSTVCIITPTTCASGIVATGLLGLYMQLYVSSIDTSWQDHPLKSRPLVVRRHQTMLMHRSKRIVLPKNRVHNLCSSSSSCVTHTCQTLSRVPGRTSLCSVAPGNRLVS